MNYGGGKHNTQTVSLLILKLNFAVRVKVEFLKINTGLPLKIFINLHLITFQCFDVSKSTESLYNWSDQTLFNP